METKHDPKKDEVNIIVVLSVLVIVVVAVLVALALRTDDKQEVGATNTNFSVAELGTTSDQQTGMATAESITVGENEEGIFEGNPLQTITLSGGCFWCTEAYLQETPGVTDAVSGYAGGSADTATYQKVSAGSTNHRESVQVTYDPARISLQEVLDVYWAHIDPTDDGGQFADRGHHYSTAIYYHTDAQREVAEASKAALQASGLFSDPIVTPILPFTTFFEAEEYHQDFYQKSSEHYERYKKASGRADFIEDNWAKEAALQFFAKQEGEASATAQNDGYVERAWTEEEILDGLKKLSPEAYKVVAQEGTEPPYNNAYWDTKEEGIYVDVVTGRPLFSSTHKYDSKTGWPSFYAPIDEDALILKTDYKLVYPRTEVRSESGHLGHLFDDGPTEHGGKRYCINSLALNFVSKADMEAQGYEDWMYLFE